MFSASRFARVPEQLLDEPVSDRAIRLFAVLDRYAGQDGRAFPSRSTLARRLACSVKTVDRTLAELVAVEFLAVDSGAPTGTSNHYRLVRPWDTDDAPPASPVTHPRDMDDPGVSHGRPTGWDVGDAQEGEPTNESHEGGEPEHDTSLDPDQVARNTAATRMLRASLRGAA